MVPQISPLIWYDSTVLLCMAQKFGMRDWANHYWLKQNFPTLARYL